MGRSVADIFRLLRVTALFGTRTRVLVVQVRTVHELHEGVLRQVPRARGTERLHPLHHQHPLLQFPRRAVGAAQRQLYQFPHHDVVSAALHSKWHIPYRASNPLFLNSPTMPWLVPPCEQPSVSRLGSFAKRVVVYSCVRGFVQARV